MKKTMQKPTMPPTSRWQEPVLITDLLSPETIEKFARVVQSLTEHECVSETKLPADKQHEIYRRMKATAKRSANHEKKQKVRKYDKAMEVVRGEKKDTG